MSVQVAVRVRPFNTRELDLKSALCVKMQGNKTILLNVDDNNSEREFVYDYSFWSHDGFTTLDNGVLIPTNAQSPYADQKQVYNALGESVLNNAWAGYHCSMFAYGQTGSGKSYSVMGYKPNIGIVPIACSEIFKRIEKNDNKNLSFEVNFGMMEIYNERVQDLLISVDKRPPQGMKIRESQSLGFYAEGLSKFPVRNFKEIEAKMDEGTSHRSVAATQMNANSSRAHTIILIEFKQLIIEDGKKIERLSVMNLVDLAGSEKVGKTGATGDRLKEAANINKSLTMLGMVISTLAELQSGKTGKKVPYRDSCLTKLLANALGGNSKTIMICAISPAWDNYEEALSTLRYADQAKKIKNKAEVNESATDKLIRELKQENMRLLKIIGELKTMDPKSPDFQKKLLELQDLQENLDANEKILSDQNKSVDERQNEMKQLEDHSNHYFSKIDQNKPYFQNLNEDPTLSGKVQYQIANENTYVGRKNGSPVPEIILNGLGIKPNHCTIQNKNGKTFLVPGSDPSIKDYLFINGKKVTAETELFHNDRVVIGTNSAFIAKLPNKKTRDGTPSDDAQIDWEYAQEEMQGNKDNQKKEQKEEIQKQMNMTLEEKLKAMEEKYQREQKMAELEKKEMANQFQQQMSEMIDSLEGGDANLKNKKLNDIRSKYNIALKQQSMANDKKEENKQQNDQISNYFAQTKFEKERQKMERDLRFITPIIDEMNLIADELQRNVKFSLKLAYDEDEKIKVLVKNSENGTEYSWEVDKTHNRYFMIKDLYEEFQNTLILPDTMKTPQKDPFWDPADPYLVGKAQMKISPVVYNRDNPSEIWIYEERTENLRGLLKLNIIPTDLEGNNLCKTGQIIHDPNQFLNKKVNVQIVITTAKLTDNLSDSFVEYIFFGKQFRTPVEKGKNQYPNYRYERIHSFKSLSKEELDYLHTGNITFKVYGMVNLKVQGMFSGVKDVDLSTNVKKQQNQQQQNTDSDQQQKLQTDERNTACCNVN